ncbi:MAG: D-aminoacyl-tRNA deacylase [Opitutales bacterium]|jgi:D-aminoacyl-tRNA deacylase|nr:D-aminoacyl-tRNA deacylase [Opitutales bacterium]MDP4642920.1 D-aminoacyl-tRNA deacylase [Opitutales bacterium]MDP4692980.1 D-aminoacyl-tRNA deacylase [Opitutales bacterium]MDP4776608.1 D-aminoacyl-tRNA deacylase [Opitutales bacterium]MDP4882770.1 D-aminoacyl-tRNA deacylase [Opitutales bacterium]
MRAVIQRVCRASVSVGDEVVGTMDCPAGGVLVFLGVGQSDCVEDVAWLVSRIVKLRIFEDTECRMNRSLLDVDGAAMVISQFTLFGNLKKGNRPSFNRAALPEQAVPLYEKFVEELSRSLGKPVATGRFGEDMQIDAANDGPVTLIVDTKERDF